MVAFVIDYKRIVLIPELRPGDVVIKAILRKAGERTVAGLWDFIGMHVDIFKHDKCANYFSSRGHDPAGSETDFSVLAPQSRDRDRMPVTSHAVHHAAWSRSTVDVSGVGMFKTTAIMPTFE